MVDKNHISSLPFGVTFVYVFDWIWCFAHFRSLQDLFASGNHINELSTLPTQLPSLEVLELSNNEITCWDEFVSTLIAMDTAVIIWNKCLELWPWDESKFGRLILLNYIYKAVYWYGIIINEVITVFMTC